jgi:hypothetical protein
MSNSRLMLVCGTLCIILPSAPLTRELGFIMPSTPHVFVCRTLGIKSVDACFTCEFLMSSISHVIVRCTLSIKSPDARLTGNDRVPTFNGCHALVCCLT